MSSLEITSFIKKYIFSALIIALSLNIISCQDQNDLWQLIIKEPGSDNTLYALDLAPDSEFELSYRHSVSGSMVYGTFKLTGQGMIQPLTTSYSSFGPGLPLDYAEEYTIENGVITVHHREEPREFIRLWVSAVTEETITTNDQSYPLYSETESHRLVEIFIEK